MSKATPLSNFLNSELVQMLDAETFRYGNSLESIKLELLGRLGRELLLLDVRTRPYFETVNIKENQNANA